MWTYMPAKPVRIVASAHYVIVHIYVCTVATMQTCVSIYSHDCA